jgi:hypothetical protein
MARVAKTPKTLEVSGEISRAALLDVVATPVELVPAPGSNQVIIVDEVEFTFRFGDVAYESDNVTPTICALYVAYDYDSYGADLIRFPNGLITGSADASCVARTAHYDSDGASVEAAFDAAAAAGNKIILSSSNDIVSGGNSNRLYYRIKYHVITLRD